MDNRKLTPPGTILAIEERDGKRYAEIRKFNPFHDARGRFSNKTGFATYSANPKTKAGALAIQRSNAGGHGRTLNVHAQSKGESITQNANWLATGQKPKVPAAVSRARYQQRKLKQQQAQQGQQTAQKPAAQTAQKPAQAAKPAAPTQKPQTQTAPKTGHPMAQGKDISKTFRPDPNSSMRTFDQVAKQQGFDKKPRVVQKAEFDAAVKASGVVAYRTWTGGRDAVSGKQKSADDFKQMLMQDDSIQAAGNGMRLYGGGTYVATNRGAKPGTAPSPQAAQNALRGSQAYGRGRASATASITLDPSAKVADYSKIHSAFRKLSSAERSRYGGDEGAYAAAKGYDAMRARGAGGSSDYMTIFNRTKLIILND